MRIISTVELLEVAKSTGKADQIAHRAYADIAVSDESATYHSVPADGFPERLLTSLGVD